MDKNNSNNKNRAIKILVSLLIVLIIAGLISGVGAYIWYSDAVQSPMGDQEAQYNFEVVEGDTLTSIAPKLEELGVLKSARAFQIYLRLNETDVDLLVGNYRIDGGVNIEGLLSELAEGPVFETVQVTIPEGLRYDEISTRLNKAFSEKESHSFSKSEYDSIAAKPQSIKFSEDVATFLAEYKPQGKSLEGFLFPDTYVIATDAGAQDIIELQIRTLMRRLEENKLDPTSKTRLKDFYEVLTLATIVEREALTYEDMRIVADIFLRRLEVGEILGADAPLLYPKKDWSYQLRKSDINDSSNPYNTRARQGLPPTPIANPGVNGIKSIYQPKKTNYVFFISANDINYYAVTYAQHCQNIAKYLGGSC